MERYDHRKIEEKWRKRWEEGDVYRTTEDPCKEKFYVLDMFPYPSGAGLHVGHPKGYIATDIVARYKKMRGFNVLHPMGWDAFGLPAEQYAIKNKVHPQTAVRKNIATFKKQLEKISLSYDWSREINTTDPDYYKWTQWTFLQMYKRGLVYRSHAPINWCPSCQTGLANEDLEGGKCERCGSEVVQKKIPQWVIRITDYADRLLDDLEKLDWKEHIKELQRNWIGRSNGALISFALRYNSASSASVPRQSATSIEVFTTRPDTLFGATYMVLAPEHDLVKEWLSAGLIENEEEVRGYITETEKKTELQRLENKEKTGVKLKGVKAINPANGRELPVFIADYVLANYGTGAIMAVPAHDERDFEFAARYNKSRTDAEEIEIKKVIDCGDLPCVEGGKLVNSGKFDGMDSEEAKKAITEFVGGKITTTYKLRDWVFGRQRYWGEPIPLVFCEKCAKEGAGEVPYIRLTGPAAPRSDENVFKFKAVTAVVKHWREDKYLFVEFTDGLWGLIGGAVKENETLEEALLRELREETVYENFRIEEVLFPKIYSRGYKKRKNRDEECEERVFLVRLLDDEESDNIGAEEGIRKWRWLKKEEALRLEMLSHHRFYFESVFVDRSRRSLAPGWFAVPEEDLPVKLPEVESYEPTGTGESPLAAIEEWVRTACPNCGGAARRETDTMPQWAGSCWYYLRYIDPHNSDKLADADKEKYWSPVDLYVGGAEHATRHLIYARFWHKFLYDIGAVSHDEPFAKLQTVGLIMAEDGRKMSKRWGNVVNPDDIIERYGADTLRLYEMFMGPFEASVAWSTDGLIGPRKFLERIWKLALGEGLKDQTNDLLRRSLHRLIKKVGDDIEGMKFNTAIAAMMSFVNDWEKEKSLSTDDLAKFLSVLSPFAPHLTQELWEKIGREGFVLDEPWPEYDESLLAEEEVTLVVQVNGKLRDTLQVPAGLSDEELERRALASRKVQKHIADKKVRKVIVVKGKLVNIVA